MYVICYAQAKKITSEILAINHNFSAEFILMSAKKGTNEDLEGRQLVGAGAGAGADAGAAGSVGVESLPLYHSEVVAWSKMGFEEKRGSTAAQLSLGDDGDAVTEQLRLVHVMCGQDYGPVCNRRHCIALWNRGMKTTAYADKSKSQLWSAPCTFSVFEQQIPDPSAWVRVNPSCGFVQNNNLGASNKSNGHRELPLHATWQKGEREMFVFKSKNRTKPGDLIQMHFSNYKQRYVFFFFFKQTVKLQSVKLPERFLVCSCRLCRRPTSSSRVSSSDCTSASDKPLRQP